jgi:protein tyrosine/serine phosphatase
MNAIRRPFLRLIAPAALAAAVATGASAQSAGTAVTAASTTSAAVTTRPTPRIDNFGIISDVYYRGAQPDQRDVQALAALGVKTVIDLTDDDGNPDEPAMVESAGMRFVKIPMNTRVAPTDEEIATFLGIVNDPQAQPVYVHCVGGRHRTGVMTAVYRMSQDGWTGERAFGEMKQYKYGPDFLHPEFKKFVLGFKPEVKVPATLVASEAAAAVQ